MDRPARNPARDRGGAGIAGAEPRRRGGGERRGGAARPGDTRRGRAGPGRRPRTDPPRGPGADAGRLVQQAMQARKDLPESAFRQVAVEVLAGQGDAEGARVCEAVRREVAQRLRIRPEIKQAMEEAFAAVLGEFRDATLQKSAVLESVGRQVHGVTGGQMREFAQRLRDAVPRPLTEEQILAWADAHQRRIGDWPITESGPVSEAPGETWSAINAALSMGLRSLPGGSSLAKLLAEHRGKVHNKNQPLLTESQIVAWADAHYKNTGEWPVEASGPVVETVGETWRNLDAALRLGNRGLPGGSSLANLLRECRGVRNKSDLPSLSIDQILLWADSHHLSTGNWPALISGFIDGAANETWRTVDSALRKGLRSLPGGSSLAMLLAEHRGIQNVGDLPALTESQILEWADAHNQRTGQWPRKNSGSITDSPGETWVRINGSLKQGNRGLPGRSSLAKLLTEKRGVKNRMSPPDLIPEQVLAWADAYNQRTGKWPKHLSGAIDEAPGETWAGIHAALVRGTRGFPSGSSLARFLTEHRGVRNHYDLPVLSAEQVLEWADEYNERTGHWPQVLSGPIEQSPEETWAKVNQALMLGLRGFAGGSSLAQLLAEHRGVRNPKNLPALTVEQILAWAHGHHERTDQWPKVKSGPIQDAPGETWARVDTALKEGLRGLPGGSSLARLLKRGGGSSPA